jgi:hypothetical protein
LPGHQQGAYGREQEQKKRKSNQDLPGCLNLSGVDDIWHRLSKVADYCHARYSLTIYLRKVGTSILNLVSSEPAVQMLY